MSTGYRKLLPDDAKFYEGDIADTSILAEIFQNHSIDTVLHFAGSIVVPESVINPLKYYRNNVVASQNLIEQCVKYGVKNFIFSSTAAVYGQTDQATIDEGSILRPGNPYANSKHVVETMLQDVSRATAMRHVILRYFNVAGADPALRTGQVVKEATHLIKIACETGLAKRPFIEIYGEDYPTNDGTCLRDYIHVTDLARAHWHAYDYMRQTVDSANIFNCGYGRAFSVKEVLDTFERVTGVSLCKKTAPRRPGDTASLVANSSLLQASTGWQPQFADLATIIESAFSWEKKLVQTPIARQ